MTELVHIEIDADDGGSEFRLGDELRGERATMGKTLLDVQRDIRIQAAYIAAIEDMDVSVFPNPSFVAGYIRSYARYLHLDPDAVFRRFCRETGFAGKSGAPISTSKAAGAKALPVADKDALNLPYRLAAAPSGILTAGSLSALGSILVVASLIAGLGWGGWTIVQNIQRVQFAPVDEVPVAMADMDPLEAPDLTASLDPGLAELARPVAATALADLYRQQELEVPILAPRDGPIATLDPDRHSPVLRRNVVEPSLTAVAGDAVAVTRASLTTPSGVAAAPTPQIGPVDPSAAVRAVLAEEAAEAGGTPPLPGADVRPVVIAERAAWVRVYLDSGTIIFEQILETGESYSPPAGVGEPRIWAGNAGSVYVRVGDTLHGPLGSGTRAVRDVTLTAAAIVEGFPPVEAVPEEISRVLAPLPTADGPMREIR